MNNDVNIANARFQFFPELDALRALAIFMTLYAHYIPEKGVWHLQNMWYGVDIFFTVSGFLITAILLKNINDNFPKSKILKNFFIKRMLRLFPLYYAFILFFFIGYHFFSLYMWKPEYELYFFTYFQNWYFFKIGNFDSHFSHLWSLGVEEQFYLIWPFLIIFLQKKALPFLFSFLILLAVFANAFYHKVPLFRNLTFSNFHTLGIGALFAYYHIEKPKWKLFEAIIQYKTIFALIALVFFIGLLNLHLPINTFFLEILKESLLAIVCLALLLLSIYGWVAPFSILTRSKIVKYIGKISYGIYLFHLPLPALYVLICTRIGIEYAIPTSVITSFILYTVLSIIAASISYHFFELKFLRIKNRFQ